MEVPRGMEPTGTNGRTRHTLSDPLVGRVSSCGGFLVGWQGTLFLVVTTTILVRRLICLRPLSGSRTATTGIGRVAGSVAGRRFPGRPYRIGFAVVMAQVRRPVPFRTRKLRPGTAMVLHSRGCGRVARRRIQLSGPSGRVPCGIPGRSFLFRMGVPVGRNAPGTPIFYAFFRCSLPVACGRLPFHNTPRITWSASVTVINDVMRLTRYVRAGSRESRYDGKRHKPDD